VEQQWLPNVNSLYLRHACNNRFNANGHFYMWKKEVILQQDNTATYITINVPQMGCEVLKRPSYTQHVAPNNSHLFGHLKESTGDQKCEHNAQHVGEVLWSFKTSMQLGL
jgi:hypothetical protein